MQYLNAKIVLQASIKDDSEKCMKDLIIKYQITNNKRCGATLAKI